MPNAILIVAESQAGALSPAVAELAGAAQRLAKDLGVPIEAALVGAGVSGAAAELGKLGASTVYTVDNPALANYQLEPYTAALEAIASQAQPSVILMSQSFQGRDLAPRLAFRLKTGIVMDCVDLAVADGRVVFEKTMYGGNARARMTVDQNPQMATIRAKAFEAATPGAGTAQVVAVGATLPEAASRFVEHVRTEGGAGIKLEDARVVVSGGRGLGSGEAFDQLEELATVLKGAVGASRGAVDAGYQPTERQIGLSGRVVSPDVYLAVALSGAAQHMAGCSGSKNIVAINRDSEATIFKYARFGVVGDWKQVLPAFTAKCKELGSA